jgi:hypothetical protein
MLMIRVLDDELDGGQRRLLIRTDEYSDRDMEALMTEREREAARLGMEALDQALMALGRRPVDQNPDFRLADPVVGDLPNVVLDSPGAAPLRFVFGPDLECVGRPLLRGRPIESI